MTSDHWELAQSIFLATLERTPTDRAGFLEEACAGDPELLDRVSKLLAAHTDDGCFDRLLAGLAPPLTAGVAPSAPPEQIGAYRVIREIGRGGMGTVFLAERADGQFEHRVALKILRLDLPDENLHRRFLAERQILAHLDHPHIARLLDGGVSVNGRPYFVMEHVEGEPIDTYCDRHRLSLVERLDLFRSVCNAVHHAHRHLVIHRDLKPTNILVTEEGTVKLLDFGIAKLLDEDVMPQTIAVTRSGMWLMTPDYASPEQVSGEAVTTASDVYQLGILLYELVTGHRPYQLPNRSLPEVSRIICNTTPPKPSTAVHRVASIAHGDGTTVEITPQSVGQARRTSSERLRRRLQGDLDNVILLALRKEPERRYGSVEQFSEDVRRYLAKLPVSARRDTILYRTATFVRRNRAGTAAALAGLLLVLGFGIAMALQALRLARERDKAEHIASFLVELFEVSDPDQARGESITAREILDSGSERIRTELEGEPGIQATMMDVIGRVYTNLGLFGEAAPLLEDALTLRRRAPNPVDADVASSLHSLGVLSLEKGEYETAEELFRQALTTRGAVHGDLHLHVAESLAGLASALDGKGEFSEALEVSREAMAMRRDLFGEVHPEVAESTNDLALLLFKTGVHDEAERHFRAALAMRRELHGELHPALAVTMTNLAWLLRARLDFEAAETLLREALAMRRDLYGERHPHVARSLSSLADLLVEREQYGAAEPLAREALAIRQELFGHDHHLVAPDLASLATILYEKGEVQEAEDLYRESIAIGNEGNAARTLSRLGTLKKDQGDYTAAEELYRKSWSVYTQALEESHPFVALVQSYLAGVLHLTGSSEEAESIYREALQKLRSAWGEEHPRTVRLKLELGELLLDVDRAAHAEPLLREVLAATERADPEGREVAAGVQLTLARCLKRLERYEEAENLLRVALGAFRNAEPTSEDAIQKAQQQLIDLYEDQ